MHSIIFYTLLLKIFKFSYKTFFTCISNIMIKNIKFLLEKLMQKLWFKPLVFLLLSIAIVLVARLADDSFIVEIVPNIGKDSLDNLISIISSSMLVISVFAVGSMISAFSSGSNVATPRSFELIISDKITQNALSVFIGSFIYSVVVTIALEDSAYGEAGYSILFLLTIVIFAVVILTFLSWVEQISKLGRLNHIIKKAEDATLDAIKERKNEPRMGGAPVMKKSHEGTPLMSSKIGYIQHIKMNTLQELAEALDATFRLNCIPGSFTAPDKPILYLYSKNNVLSDDSLDQIRNAFVIKDNRSFYADPRFGLTVLSEIASKALSSGINDPGTAIAVIGSYVRIFTTWVQHTDNVQIKKITYNRIEVPELSIADMFDDAFLPVARDGADNLEVMIRLQKALMSIANISSADTKKLVGLHARKAFERSKLAMEYQDDLEVLKKHCVASVYNSTN